MVSQTVDTREHDAFCECEGCDAKRDSSAIQVRMNIDCSPNVDEHGTCLSVVREYFGSGYRIIANVQAFYPDDVAPVVGRIYMTQAGRGRIVWADGTTYDHDSFSKAQDAVSA